MLGILIRNISASNVFLWLPALFASSLHYSSTHENTPLSCYRMKTLSILHTVIPPHTRAIDRSCALIISLGLECLCTPQLAFDQHVSIFYTAVWTGSPDEEREQENVGFWLFALYGMAHGQHLRRCLFMRTVFTYASMHTGFACVFVYVRAHARVGISTDQYIPPCCHLCPGRLQAAPYTLTLFLQPHTVSVHFGLFGGIQEIPSHVCISMIPLMSTFM